jgi:DNA-binding protein WhiA
LEGFSKQTKDELVRVMPKSSCCRRAELAALFHAAGSLHLVGGKGMTVSVSVENAGVARKAHLILQEEFQVSPQIRAERIERLGRHRRYSVVLDEPSEVENIMVQLGLMTRGHSLESGISSKIARSECCRASFLRGVFLARGSITDPQKKSYHLEFVTENEEFASGLCYLMNLCRFKAKVGRRKHYLVYLKNVDAIARFLTFISAHAALLQLEEIRVVKEMRGEVNRQVNCDTANLEKTISAAMEQLEAIKAYDLQRLPESLREAAILRLEHPEASLKELGEFANPKMSKSAVNHRLRRLMKWIEGNN